jgi:hypothetical protein
MTHPFQAAISGAAMFRVTDEKGHYWDPRVVVGSGLRFPELNFPRYPHERGLTAFPRGSASPTAPLRLGQLKGTLRGGFTVPGGNLMNKT